MLDSYLKRMNPKIPLLVDDLRLTGEGLGHLLPGDAADRQILRNSVKTTGTFEDQEAKLKALFNNVTAFSDTPRTSSTRTVTT